MVGVARPEDETGMLRVSALRRSGNDWCSRRGFLQAGALGVGGLTLAHLAALRAQGAVRSGAAGTSVILIWLSGGPGHMETWDPKPQAPAEYRGPLGAIETSVSGVQFSDLMPRQAAIMQHL